MKGVALVAPEATLFGAFFGSKADLSD